MRIKCINFRKKYTSRIYCCVLYSFVLETADIYINDIKLKPEEYNIDYGLFKIDLKNPISNYDRIKIYSEQYRKGALLFEGKWITFEKIEIKKND